MTLRLTGLIAATFTPLHPDGALALERVGPMVEQLLADGVSGLYVAGSTGEGVSLTTEERMAVAAAFEQAAQGRVPVVVQVGHNSLAEARRLAGHAQQIGAAAISATPPTYFKPETVEALVECLAEITAGAPGLPFYYYHIPMKTGVLLDMTELLRVGGSRLPTLNGIKFTSSAVHEFQAALEFDGGRFDALWGLDEMLLSALSVGARGAVGSTYNLAAPLYRRLIAALDRGDRAEAARCQSQSVAMVRAIVRFPGGIPAQKAMMKMIGHDCGPPRLPLKALDSDQTARLHQELTDIGFFQWGRSEAE